jgi:hypothetical protein
LGGPIRPDRLPAGLLGDDRALGMVRRLDGPVAEKVVTGGPIDRNALSFQRFAAQPYPALTGSSTT